ncbi:MAG: hypothetical protein ACD_15C00133G0035 [uncultured bacterium]|nr:MAG: hypothetical protein ACD_15C00133G0035 [uncultured bacterium]
MLGFIAIVLIIIIHISFSNRIKRLEDKISGQVPATGNVPSAAVSQSNIQPQSRAMEKIFPEPASIAQNQMAYAPQARPAIEKTALERFVLWLAEEWPLKAGIFLLILAVGWFVTYAFINDWIGEVGRITLGVLFGALILSAGFFRTAKHQLQGNALLILGATSILISIISGIGLYNLFPATVALIVAFILVAFMTYVALQQKNLSLAVVTISMGSIVPIFVFLSVDISIIFLYLFVLAAGTLWVTSRTGWNALNIISLVVVFLYSVAYDNFEGFDDNLQNLIFAFVFIFLFYFSSIATILFKKSANAYDLVVAGGTGMLFLIWMMMIASEQSLVYLIVFGVLLFALGAYVIFSMTKEKNPVILYSAVALVLLVSATAIQFDSWELTVAYIVEFSSFIMINLYLKSKEEISSKFNLSEAFGLVLYVVLFVMSLTNIERIFNYIDRNNYYSSRSYYEGQQISIGGDLLVIILLCVMSFLITIFAMKLFYDNDKTESNKMTLIRFYGVLGGFYSVILIWVMAHLMIQNQTTATMLSLVIYTLAGVCFYAAGKKNDHGLYKAIGGILFGVVLLRLFLVEFGNMDIVEKIITFFVVGILFVSTTFIGRKNKENTVANNSL